MRVQGIWWKPRQAADGLSSQVVGSLQVPGQLGLQLMSQRTYLCEVPSRIAEARVLEVIQAVLAVPEAIHCSGTSTFPSCDDCTASLVAVLVHPT
jgi:hypothetical protein